MPKTLFNFFFRAIWFIISFHSAALDNGNQGVSVFRFGFVVERIEFNGIASLPCEIYRYHAVKRIVSTDADLKIQSIYLRIGTDLPCHSACNAVEYPMPDSAVVEVIGKTGDVRYNLPRVVHFDATALVSEGANGQIERANEDSDNGTIDGQLVIISNDSQPYDWDLFYVLPSASGALDD